MDTVTLRELTHRAGALVDRAHAGETIMITRNGRPWARLVPELGQTGSDYLDQLLVEGRVAAPTADFSDYTVQPPTGGWDGRDAGCSRSRSTIACWSWPGLSRIRCCGRWT